MEKLAPEVRARAHLGSGNKKLPLKIMNGARGQKLTFAPGAYEEDAVLYLQNCEQCDITLQTKSTKVMVERCKDLKLTIEAKIATNSAEVWHCDNVELVVRSELAMQMDLCNNAKVTYEKSSQMPQIVWAGMRDFRVEFEDRPDEVLETGIEQVKAEYGDDVKEDISQFIVRIVDDKLLQERVIRLPNGFPTTQREADAFDAQVALHDSKVMEHVRGLLKENPQLAAGLKAKNKAVTKKNAGKKVGVNDPCTCGSGKKYKKCCLNR